MTEQECGKLLLEYSQFWPLQGDMRLKVRAYFHSLEDLNYLQCQRALILLSRTMKFAPTASEIREATESLKRAELPEYDWVKAGGRRAWARIHSGKYRDPLGHPTEMA